MWRFFQSFYCRGKLALGCAYLASAGLNDDSDLILSALLSTKHSFLLDPKSASDSKASFGSGRAFALPCYFVLIIIITRLMKRGAHCL